MPEIPTTVPTKPPSGAKGDSESTPYFRKAINNIVWRNILITAALFLLLASGGFLVQNSILEKPSQEPSTPSAKPREHNLPPVIEDISVEKGKWPFNKFSVSWSDPENDPAMAIWCKNDNVKIDVGKPPSCPEGVLISQADFSSAGRFNMTYHASKSGEAYAFVCDNLGACSSSVRKTYSPVPRIGYDPNHAPEISEFLITSSSNPQVKLATTTFTVGQVIYFRLTVEDLADSVRVIICKTAEVEYNSGDLTCPGDAWSGPTPKYFTVPTMIVPRTTSTEEMAGNHSAFAFACDSGAHCSKAAESFFEVENQQPVPSEDTND